MGRGGYHLYQEELPHCLFQKFCLSLSKSAVGCKSHNILPKNLKLESSSPAVTGFDGVPLTRVTPNGNESVCYCDGIANATQAEPYLDLHSVPLLSPNVEFPFARTVNGFSKQRGEESSSGSSSSISGAIA